MIPISPGNRGVSEKAGSGSRGDGFLGLGKSGWKPLAVSRRKYWAGSAQLKANGFILTSRRAKKLIPVMTSRVYGWKITGKLRWTYIVPRGSLAAAGIYQGTEVDKPIELTDTNLFLQLYWVITREAEDGKVYAPQEKISREIALKVASTWAAHYVLKEDLLGFPGARQVCRLPSLGPGLSHNSRGRDTGCSRSDGGGRRQGDASGSFAG